MRRNFSQQGVVLSCCSYKGVLTYPKDLERIFLSNLPLIRPQAGTQVIREQIISQPTWQQCLGNSTLVFYEIRNLIEEEEWSPSWIWMFDREGNFLGQHWDRGKRFDGINPDKRRFQKGDLVQFVTDFDSQTLQLGIVLGVPWSKQRALEVNQKIAPLHLDESDNTYAVYAYCGESLGHYHLPECYLFSPTGIITSSAQERLLGLLVLLP